MIKKALIPLFILFLLLLSGCGTTSNETKSTTEKEQVKQGEKELTFGFFSATEDPEKASKYVETFIKKLNKETGLKVKMVLAISYDDLEKQISEGKIDIAFDGALPLVEAEKHIKVEPILKALTHGKGSYRSEFIVKKDSPINSIDDLVKQKGLLWAFADEGSTSGYLFPIGLLKTKGIDNPKEYFTPVMAGGHDKAIVSVYTGNADFATSAEGVSRSLVEQYPDILEKTKVIGYTEEIPGQTIMVKSSLSQDTKDKIQTFMSKKDKETLSLIYNAFKMEGFEKATSSEYDIVRETSKLLENK